MKNKPKAKAKYKCFFCKKPLKKVHPLWADPDGTNWRDCCPRCFERELKKEEKPGAAKGGWHVVTKEMFEEFFNKYFLKDKT